MALAEQNATMAHNAAVHSKTLQHGTAGHTTLHSAAQHSTAQHVSNLKQACNGSQEDAEEEHAQHFH